MMHTIIAILAALTLSGCMVSTGGYVRSNIPGVAAAVANARLEAASENKLCAKASETTVELDVRHTRRGAAAGTDERHFRFTCDGHSANPGNR